MPRQGLAWAFARSSPAHSIVRGQLVAQMGRAAGGSAFGHPAAQLVDRAAAGNRHDPRQQAAPLRVIAGRSLPDLQKYLLLDVLGGRTAYWTYGPDDAETTVVAVHGFRGEHHGLEPVVAHLPGVRVIMPDLPGFGETPPLPGRRHDIERFGNT